MSISLQKYRGATSLAIVCTMVFVAALSFATFSRVEAQVNQNQILLANDDSSDDSNDDSNDSDDSDSNDDNDEDESEDDDSSDDTVRSGRGTINDLRSNIQERRELNKDIRNKILEDRKLADEQAKDARKGALESIKLERKAGIAEIRRDIPTSSRERGEAIKEIREKEKAARQEVRSTYKKEEFAARKTALVARLNLVLGQLTTAYTKISTRVDEAEKAGKDVGNVPVLLDEAADKIDAAKVAVTELTNYTPSSSETASTTEIIPGKAREVGEAAITAVKEAHAALKKAITTLVSIVKANAPTPVAPAAPVAPTPTAPAAVSADSTN
jgi:hypothetical protein